MFRVSIARDGLAGLRRGCTLYALLPLEYESFLLTYARIYYDPPHLEGGAYML
jgi:hypothetical protein